MIDHFMTKEELRSFLTSDIQELRCRIFDALMNLYNPYNQECMQQCKDAIAILKNTTNTAPAKSENTTTQNKEMR